MVNVIYLLEFDTWHSIEWVGVERRDGHAMSSTSHIVARLVSGSLLAVKCWNKSGMVVLDIFDLGFVVIFFAEFFFFFAVFSVLLNQ